MTAGNVPFIFAANTTIVSAQVNSDFAALVTDLNAIDALQITSGTFSITRFPIVTLAKGGSGADLSATGPGLVRQATNGSVLTIAADGQLPATATNDNAAAGKIGEFQTNNNIGAPFTLASNTATNMTSLALTAGDWDIYGDITLNASAAMTTIQGGISATSAAFSATGNYTMTNALGFAQFANFGVPIIRLSAGITVTVYLIALAIFAGGTTVAASGTINARRAR